MNYTEFLGMIKVEWILFVVAQQYFQNIKWDTFVDQRFLTAL